MLVGLEPSQVLLTFLRTPAFVQRGATSQAGDRWVGSSRDAKATGELVALGPDLILAGGNSTLAPLLQAIRTVPRACCVARFRPGLGLLRVQKRRKRSERIAVP